MIAITIDIDWAPNQISLSIINLLNSYNIPYTIYCTDYNADHSGNSHSLIEHVNKQSEIGLHPNFIEKDNYLKVFQDLLKIYPSVKGFRSHNGMTGWPISETASKLGLKYETYCTIYHKYIDPFKINANVLDFYIFTTCFFDSQMLNVPSFDWDFRRLWFSNRLSLDNEIYILGFHPNILYYDMGNIDEYLQKKPYYHVPRPKESYEHKKSIASMKLLVDLLENFPTSCFTTPYQFGSSYNWDFQSTSLHMPRLQKNKVTSDSKIVQGSV